MNRIEMLKRLEAGEDPLDLSIEKFRELIEKGLKRNDGKNN